MSEEEDEEGPAASSASTRRLFERDSNDAPRSSIQQVHSLHRRVEATWWHEIMRVTRVHIRDEEQTIRDRTALSRMCSDGSRGGGGEVIRVVQRGIGSRACDGA